MGGQVNNLGNRTSAIRRQQSNYSAQGWSGGKPFPLVRQKVASTTTAFEDFVSELHVPEQYWHQDRRIAKWVRAHKNHRYIPESLLDALGEKVLDDGVVL
jgi:hypothetical protein